MKQLRVKRKLKNKIMIDLFEIPIKKTKVKRDIFAYMYRNGCINIDGQKYFGYSMSEAIKEYRSKTKK